MPSQDRRTDNWGGYRDYNRDPNQYHFAKSTKELGWGWYRSLDKDQPLEYVEKRYTLSQLFFMIVAVFFVCAFVPEIRQIPLALGYVISNWWSQWDVFLGAING